MEEVKKLEKCTYDDYLKVNKTTDERAELIFWKIYMTPAPSATHQDVVGNLFYQLKRATQEDSACKPRVSPFDLKIEVDNSLNIVQPDVMIFCKDSSIPCAVFEVVSKATLKKDRTVKKELYQKSKIDEYFLVDYSFMVIKKFKIVDGEYHYIEASSLSQLITVECIDKEIAVDAIFEGIESHEE